MREEEGVSGPRVEELLRSFGYSSLFREAGWTECLLVWEDERWLGRGEDRAQAFADAVRQAFPSQAARRALALAAAIASGDRIRAGGRAAEADLSGSPTSAPSRSLGDASLWDAIAGETSGTVSTEGGSLPLSESSARAASETSTRAEDSRSEPSPSVVLQPTDAQSGEDRSPTDAAHELTTELAVRDLDVVELQPQAAGRRLDPLTSAEALVRLKVLAETIRCDREEGALWTPDRQRLLLLGWISHARSVQDAARGDPLVHARVAALARDLAKLSNTWWPGTVGALRLDTAPCDCAGDLSSAEGESPRTWLEVAQAAEERLARIEAEDQAAGRDEFGWADAAYLDPAPPDPETRLRAIALELDRLTEPVARRNSSRPTRDALVRVESEAWEKIASRARWLRSSATDIEAWGKIVGTLRWVAANLPSQRCERLHTLLDPASQPPRAWALVCGWDPEKRARQRLKKDVLARAPQAEDHPAMAGVLAWVREAVAVSEIEYARIATILSPFADMVTAIDASSFSKDRPHRNRLRKIQEVLRASSTSAPASPASPKDAEPTSESYEIEAPEGGADASPAPTREEVLLAALRPRTSGKRALFVTNRNDPTLVDKLRELFAFESIEACDVQPRRVAAKAQSVASHSYDFVLAATGFIPHKVDALLVEACRAADTLYVRVNRGRPQACILGLARELGVRESPEGARST